MRGSFCQLFQLNFLVSFLVMYYLLSYTHLTWKIKKNLKKFTEVGIYNFRLPEADVRNLWARYEEATYATFRIFILAAGFQARNFSPSFVPYLKSPAAIHCWHWSIEVSDCWWLFTRITVLGCVWHAACWTFLKMHLYSIWLICLF